jgi:hypothetical protein
MALSRAPIKIQAARIEHVPVVRVPEESGARAVHRALIRDRDYSPLLGGYLAETTV